MHRIFFAFVLSIVILAPSFSMPAAEYVSSLENRLFGVTYDSQSIDSRIDRIEKQIYDNVYAGSPEERLSKIEKIYPFEEFENKKTIRPQNYYEQEYVEEYQPAEYNNYPVVSKIEKTIYQRDYSGEDIYKRLARLEKELYGQEKSDMTLQERVENLKSVLPKKERKSIAGWNNTDTAGLGGNSGGIYYDYSTMIGELEQETFKRTFKNDSSDKRLSRLEQFYFGQSSDGQSDDERITRLTSVIMTDKNINSSFPYPKSAQWAEILMNLLIVGLGFLL